MRLLPKEHGAYAQVTLPLSTALGVAGATLPSLLLALAVVLGFLAHEPLVVCLGLRGERSRRALGATATRALLAEGMAAAVAAGLALWLMPPASRWSLLWPLVPAAALAGAVARGHAKSLLAELCAALAFALAAVPVCLAAGTSGQTAWTVALPFALIFVVATGAVRAVTQAGRGAMPAAVWAGRVATVVAAALGCAGLAMAGARGWLPWSAPVAALPGALLASMLAIVPPPAKRLKAVGWALLATSIAAAVVLAAA